jgi:uncharacterized protein YggE
MDRTISVTGHGRVVTAPDVADVRLGVVVTRPTVREARGVAADVAARVLAAVRAAGIESADIQTEALAVQPEYEYDQSGQRLKGQQVAHRYALTVRNLESLGTVIDDALAAGATNLEGVNFRYHAPLAAERQARIAAMADARERAELLAAEGGVALGKVISIAELEGGLPPRPLARMKLAMAEDASTPVEAGSVEIEAAVAVVFEIA